MKSLKLAFKIVCLFILVIPGLALAAARPPLTVMAYNIFQLSTPGNWDHTNRLSRLAGAINSLPSNPDVIVFSEVFTDAAESVIKGMTKYPYRTEIVGKTCSGFGWNKWSGACSTSPLVIRGGVMIVSKYPISKKYAYVYWASHTGTWDNLSNKGFAYVTIEKQGYKYHVVGTHLQATEGDNNNEEHATRMNQLAEMRYQIDQYQIPLNEPVIIAGDLNVEYSKTSEVNRMLSESRSVLSFPNNQGFGSYSGPKNWMTRSNLYSSSLNLDYDDTLDYVMSRSDHLQPVRPAAMQVVNLKASNSWYWGYMKGWWDLSTGWYYHNGYHSELSDHFPVVATYNY